MNDYNNLEFERQNTPEEMGMRMHTLGEAVPLALNTIVVNYMNVEAIQPAINHIMAAPQPQLENPLVTEQPVTDINVYRQKVKEAHDLRKVA